MGKSEVLEKELISHGIQVDDIPPKVWSVSSKGFINAAANAAAVAVTTVSGAGRAAGLAIPISGVSLGRIVTEYWHKRK
jgi:hypothetical protein